MEITRLIEALALPGAYPHSVENVEVRQTHISAVFLAGEFVYKIKKSVSLGFLDFSTLEKRRHFCEEEVRLNRRLAPHAYLGVIPVAQTPKGIAFEAEGEVVEWAVKMQRLPGAATLQERLRRNEVDVELVTTLACRVASFHRVAEANERISAFGRFEVVSRNTLDVFDRAAPQVGTIVDAVVFGRVKMLAEAALARLSNMIEVRAARGMPRDCHGDLHLDHVYVFPDREPPADFVIIDCIEFNESFRCLDPVADMAFAAMDLAFEGRRDLASAFADAYFRAAADEDGRALLPLYSAYRATVRGLVGGILIAENETSQIDRAAARSRASAHWLLALTELEKPGRKPCLILLAGLPGTGKSTLAQKLAESADFCVIRSDVVRKELAAAPLSREELYCADWNERTYAECLLRVERLILEGKRVIVDATFREEKNRRTFLEAAVRWGVPGHLLHCQVETDTARLRLAKRQGDVSDADWNIHLELAEAWEEFAPSTRRAVHPVSTDGTPEQALAAANAVLRQHALQESTPAGLSGR
jgi:uncharacterized protein